MIFVIIIPSDSKKKKRILFVFSVERVARRMATISRKCKSPYSSNMRNESENEFYQKNKTVYRLWVFYYQQVSFKATHKRQRIFQIIWHVTQKMERWQVATCNVPWGLSIIDNLWIFKYRLGAIKFRKHKCSRKKRVLKSARELGNITFTFVPHTK